MQIAVVEDDVALNMSIENILNDYNVDIYFDGNSILNTNKSYDLYIIDINLPDISGLELIDKLNGKIIIISANITSENIHTAYTKGAVDFIKKPFFKEELLHKINILFPNQIKLGDHLLDIENCTFDDIKLSKSEIKFLELFKDKHIVGFDEIYLAIEKTDTALYSFISRLRKKININFENIKGIGYKILI